MIGIKKCVIAKPPIKNPTTAIREGICKSLKPLMACPDVQPPAYRAPTKIISIILIISKLMMIQRWEFISSWKVTIVTQAIL